MNTSTPASPSRRSITVAAAHGITARRAPCRTRTPLDRPPSPSCDDRAVPPPSVDALARTLADLDLPAPLLVDAARAAIAAGDPDSARRRGEAIRRALLGPVVNATGVLLHTNLGRAPLHVHQE